MKHEEKDKGYHKEMKVNAGVSKYTLQTDSNS